MEKIIIALVLCVVSYLAGILSGVASKSTESKWYYRIPVLVMGLVGVIVGFIF